MRYYSDGPSSPRHLRADGLRATAGLLSWELQSQLRALYDDLLDQPIPERLAELVRRFDAATALPGQEGDQPHGTIGS